MISVKPPLLRETGGERNSFPDLLLLLLPRARLRSEVLGSQMLFEPPGRQTSVLLHLSSFAGFGKALLPGISQS